MTSNTTPSLFAQLAKVGKREIVDIEGIKIEIVEMSFGERSKLAELHDKHKGQEGSGAGIAFMRIIIHRCCYAPGTNDRLCATEESVGDLPHAIATTLFEHAKRVNGMGVVEPLEPDPDAEEPIHEPSEAEKNG
jgi:hypothetical protein